MIVSVNPCTGGVTKKCDSIGHIFLFWNDAHSGLLRVRVGVLVWWHTGGVPKRVCIFSYVLLWAPVLETIFKRMLVGISFLVSWSTLRGMANLIWSLHQYAGGLDLK